MDVLKVASSVDSKVVRWVDSTVAVTAVASAAN